MVATACRVRASSWKLQHGFHLSSRGHQAGIRARALFVRYRTDARIPVVEVYARGRPPPRMKWARTDGPRRGDRPRSDTTPPLSVRAPSAANGSSRMRGRESVPFRAHVDRRLDMMRRRRLRNARSALRSAVRNAAARAARSDAAVAAAARDSARRLGVLDAHHHAAGLDDGKCLRSDLELELLGRRRADHRRRCRCRWRR